MVKRAYWCLFGLIFVLLCLVKPASAADTPNNKYGIYITDISEVQKAAELVNSNGGEWGYVSFVINSNDRKVDKWQDRMNQLNEKKLIPIVRIATYTDGSAWTKPVKDDAHDWAVFLNSLSWPTKQKIVLVYNEPNHGTEWGGETNPAEYAQVLNETIDALKDMDSDFVVLNAGFDASSPNEPPRYMDQLQYMKAMEAAVPGIFSKLDGWSSHSYPNPGFSGSVNDTGRGSIRTYEWELDILRKEFNVTKNLPVYITETGWIAKNADHPRLKYSEEDVGNFTKQAFEKVWIPDNRVVAVTPFMLIYRDSLFSHFSWLRADNSETPTFGNVKSLTKTAGKPEQEFGAAITTVSIPSQIEKGREVIGTIAFKNTGNAIWQDGMNLSLSVIGDEGMVIRDNFSDFKNIRLLPRQTHIFRFTLLSTSERRRTTISFQMKNGNETFGERLYVPVKVFHPPTMSVAVINPPQKEVLPVNVVFSRENQTDTIGAAEVGTDGKVGRYTSYLLVPEELIDVTVTGENREPVTIRTRVNEGENLVSFTLPNELPFWTRLFRR